MQVRILTWNIHKGVGGVDRRYRLDRTAALIRHHEPDIALLQEVAEGWPQARFEHQLGELQDLLGYPHVAFGDEHRYQRGGYGNAILSRFPLHDVHRIDLTIGRRKRRGALQARAIVRDAGHQRTLVLHNLHLGLAGSERALQLARFMEHEAQRHLHGDTPTIIGGDFNDLWGTLGQRFLEPAGYRRAVASVNTFPAAMPFRPLDGLFFRGNAELKSGHVGRGELARAASDHLPLIADFDIPLAGG
jgi:endonuclease/exonuclease/phosphatase family metal-dependent hydrolase